MPTPRYHINLFWSDEDKSFIADIPDLRFCSAHGPTPEIALREILAAQKAWLTSAEQARWNRAKLNPAGRTRYVAIKLDRALLNRADLLAHKRNLTRDQFITQLLKAALARRKSA